MKIPYTVHSCDEQQVEVTVEFQGNATRALVTGLVVELVSDDGVMGHTYRIVPASDAERDAAKKLFTPGAKVVATFKAA